MLTFVSFYVREEPVRAVQDSAIPTVTTIFRMHRTTGPGDQQESRRKQRRSRPRDTFPLLVVTSNSR